MTTAFGDETNTGTPQVAPCGTSPASEQQNCHSASPSINNTSVFVCIQNVAGNACVAHSFYVVWFQ